MAGRRAKRSEIWAYGVSIQCTQGTCDTSVIKVILGSFGAFPIFKKKTNCILKTAARRAKWIEIWASGVSIQCTQGAFDTQVVKVILGSFGFISDFRKTCISKTAGRRAKQSEIWTSGVSIQRIQGTFDT